MKSAVKNILGPTLKTETDENVKCVHLKGTPLKVGFNLGNDKISETKTMQWGN